MSKPPIIALLALLALAACDDAADLLGRTPEIKRAPGERVDVVLAAPTLKADAEVASALIEIPEQTNLVAWPNRNTAMLTPHVGLTGITREQSGRVGDGNRFSRSVVASPIVLDGRVFAMDAAGVVSAHNETDISDVQWRNTTGTKRSIPDVLGGGLAAEAGVVFATTGYGNVRALEAASGKDLWNIQVGAPVRGAPAVAEGTVVVLTADNQTLAFDATTGKPRWEHRGIRESAGYFATTAPVISEGIVVTAYSSGEVFAIRAESGSVLWSDTLSGSSKTKAAAVFSGIDADPIVQDGVVVVAAASGEMQASALLNGRPLWQKKIGTHTTPWSAGNALFLLSDSDDVAALFKRDGSVRWAESLKRAGSKKTPALFPPILAGNALLVLDAEGTLTTFKPDTGARLNTYDLADGVVSAPIIANGALYVLTRDARLHKYY